MVKFMMPVFCVLLLQFGAAAQTVTVPGTKLPAYQVPGLALPAPRDVPFDEGFVDVIAECKGTVKWLIISTDLQVRFKVRPQIPNEVTIAIPPESGTIVIFAIGVVDGQQTDFARTQVTVHGKTGFNAKNKVRPQLEYPLHLTLIEDPAKRTPSIRNILDSRTLEQELTKQKIVFRNYTYKDGRAEQFQKIWNTHGLPVLILQQNNGGLIWSGPVPETVDGVLNRVREKTR